MEEASRYFSERAHASSKKNQLLTMRRKAINYFSREVVSEQGQSNRAGRLAAVCQKFVPDTLGIV